MTVSTKNNRSEAITVIDGTATHGAKFERVIHGAEMAILITHPDLRKPLMITAPVLGGINGWLARWAKELGFTTEVVKH